MVGLKQFHEFFSELSVVYERNESYLTELDSAIGDADHGVNMKRGFQAVKSHLEESPPDTVGGLLKAVSMQLIKTVGGASGPLYGTLFLRASAAVGDKQSLGSAEILNLFREGVAGVISRGKAGLGEKTMVDAWLPAITAMEQEPGGIKEMLGRGVEAAEAGMKSTVNLLAKKGRASYLGERSVGHQDPGATSTYLMLKTAYETLA